MSENQPEKIPEKKSRKKRPDSYLKADLPKREYALWLLKLMYEYTDEEHTLSLNAVTDLFNQVYADTHVRIDPKTARNNLKALVNAGFPLGFRMYKQRNRQEPLLTDWYYQHEFTPGELHFLIDSVMFTGAMPENHLKDLIKKIENLYSQNFQSVMPVLNADQFKRLDKSTFFMIIELLHQAIAEQKQVEFSYQDCDINFKWKTRTHDDVAKRYRVNPYQLVAANGRCYLLCNMPGKPGLSHFRVDRIDALDILDTSASLLSGIQLSKYLQEHPHLWSGDPVRVTFICKDYMMNDVSDWFGTDPLVTPIPDSENMIRVQLLASEEAMFRWAIQYADDVEIISPRALRERVAETLHRSWDKYRQKKEVKS